MSGVLEPGRPVKTDKLAILGDAIRVVNQLKTESQEYKEMNEKLLDEIKTLKVKKSQDVSIYQHFLFYKHLTPPYLSLLNLKQAEKNELREEKLVLKTNKEKIEQQLKTMAVPPPTGFMPPHPPMYQAAANKMPMFPSYSLVPMWQYLPPSIRDTSQDHELRPPAA